MGKTTFQPPNPKEITLHPKQFDAFDFKTQFGAAIAGVRGGKTFVGSAWAGNKIATMKGNGLIGAPDYRTLRDATLDTFFKMFPSYRKYYKEQKSVIEFPGKNVYLRSFDDPLSAEGLTVDWAWLDEAGRMKLLAWIVARSRVSLTKGQVFLTTTPYNMGWMYQDIYKPWMEQRDKDITVVSWSSVENPYFPQDVYEAEKRRLPAQEFKRRYKGQFTRMQGLVYDLPSWCIVEPEELKPDITLGGIDWGWSNPAALIVIKYAKGRYYLVDEWYQINKTTAQIVEAAINFQNKHGVNRWYADSANPEKIVEANTNTGLSVVPYEKKKDSISSGVSTINQYLLDNRLFIFRGMLNTLAEFESYQYPEPDESGLIKKDEPMPFNNHLMDAMRYAILGYQPAKRVRMPEAQGSYTELNVRRMLGPTGYGTEQRRSEDYL